MQNKNSFSISRVYLAKIGLRIRSVAFKLVIFITVSAIGSLCLGLHSLNFAEIFNTEVATVDSVDRLVLFNLRIPRTAVAILCGAGISLAGLFMQTATRNELAEPGLTGVNSGAALAVVLATVAFGSQSLLTISTVAIVGALLTVSLVFLIASASAMERNAVLLVGASMAALTASVTQSVLVVNERAMEDLLFWLAGGFADRPIVLLPYLAVALIGIWVWTFSRHPALDLLLNEDALSKSIGLNVVFARTSLLAAAAIIAGISVSICGPVGFLGLLAPHLARFLKAQNHRQLLILTPLCGILIALTADIAARYVVSPAEAPITSMLAMVGAPWLFWLLRRSHFASI